MHRSESHSHYITELNLWTALTQADGFRRVENPPFWRGLSLPVLVRLLLPQLLRGAMSWLVVVEFERLIAQLLVVLHHIYFSRLPLLLVLDWDARSSCMTHCYWVCSMCAGDSCNSDVPFCDRCNTQLHVSLLSFLLLVPSA